MWSRMLSHIGPTTVITRTKHRPFIEEGLAAIPEDEPRPSFVYVEAPKWATWWQIDDRALYPYYMLWQLSALRTARKLHRDRAFDVVWHLTWANAWLGAVGALVRARFAYGPVGGGVPTPWRLARALGMRGMVADAFRTLLVKIGRYLNPLARADWRRAELILVQNPETRDWFPSSYRDKVVVMPHVVLEADPPDERPAERPRVMLFAGRLLPWKGVALALETLRLLPDWELVVCGEGPDKDRLVSLAGRLGVSERVRFTGWLTHEEVLGHMARAGVFVFPSLHDEAGWVVVEAHTRGLPVVCLDHGGPRVLGGRGVEVGSPSATAERLAKAIVEADPPQDFDPYDLDGQLKKLRALVGERFGA